MPRVAIIGLGKIGLMHASVVNVLPHAELACLIDSNASLVGRAKSLIGDHVPFYATLEEALARQRLDAAFICTPHFAHESVALRCLERGLHVFSEKPMSNSLKSATLMRDKARATGRMAAVGYMKLYYPHYAKAQALVQEGAIGRPLSFQASLHMSQVLRPPKGWMYEPSLAGGGVMMTCGCHTLSLLNRWFGLPRRLQAKATSVFSPKVEDAAEVTMEFESGLRGTFAASWSAPGYPFETTEIQIQGTAGRLTAHDAGLVVTPTGGPEQSWHRSQFDQAAYDFSPDYGGEGYYNEDADFLRSCVEKTAPHVSFEEGVAVQTWLDAIYRSFKEGPVTL